jgi:hypothetical protein
VQLSHIALQYRNMRPKNALTGSQTSTTMTPDKSSKRASAAMGAASEAAEVRPSMGEGTGHESD